MGFVTKGLIKGRERRRSFHPISADIRTALLQGDAWEKDNEVCARIDVLRSDGDRQYLYLTESESNAAFQKLLELTSIETRLKIAKDYISNLDDAALLQFLKSLLASR